MKNHNRFYFAICLGGCIFNIFSLMFADYVIGFDEDVYLYCGWFYALKTSICYTFYFLFSRERNLANASRRRVILWAPVWFFYVYFLLIHGFPSKFFMKDISLGFAQDFDHFAVQISSITCVTVYLSWRLKRTWS